MKLPDFPDKPPTGHNKLPATIENVDHLLKHADIRVRYNVIKKKDEVAVPGHQGTMDNLDNVTLSTIVSLASKHGLPTGHITDYVQVIADRNAYNPVADWIRSRPWDGTDRMADICGTVIEQDDYPPVLKIILIRKWLLSAVAAALMPNGFKCRGVLTLQGPQGIGKTSWVKALVTDAKLRDEVIKLDHHLDASNKDTILGAITNWIVGAHATIAQPTAKTMSEPNTTIRRPRTSPRSPAGTWKMACVSPYAPSARPMRNGVAPGMASAHVDMTGRAM